MSIAERIARSASDFEAIVWPELAPPLGGGELMPGEAADSPFAHLLDTEGMTDVWQIIGDGGLRALSTRVQYDDGQSKKWKTWTVRRTTRSGKPTEWDKLLDEEERHRPSYHVQAYLSERGGVFREAAYIGIPDLTTLLRDHAYWGPVPVPGGNTMVVVEWAAAERRGMRVVRCKPPAPQLSLNI